MASNFQKVLEEVQQEWMDLNGVEAVGQGTKDGKDCIEVFISEKSPGIERTIPSDYKSVPVVIRDSGGAIDIQ